MRAKNEFNITEDNIENGMSVIRKTKTIDLLACREFEKKGRTSQQANLVLGEKELLTFKLLSDGGRNLSVLKNVKVPNFTATEILTFDSETLNSRKQAVSSHSFDASPRDQLFEASSESIYNDNTSSKKSKNKLNLKTISPIIGAQYSRLSSSPRHRLHIHKWLYVDLER